MPKFRTVADVVADLQKMPQDAPVVAGCHYDNDDGLTNEFRVSLDQVEHSEDRFYGYAPSGPGHPGAFQAVVIS